MAAAILPSDLHSAASNEYRSTLIELIAHHMVGEALGADALSPHFHLCPDLESRKNLGLILAQEAKHGFMLGELLVGLGEDPNEHFRSLTRKGFPPYHRLMIAETSWIRVIVGSVFMIDPTGIAFMVANRQGNYPPLCTTLNEILKDEAFHVHYGKEQCALICQTEAGRRECQSAIDTYFPIALKVMGKKDSARALRYQAMGLRTEDASRTRNRYLEMVIPAIERLGLNVPAFEMW